jgi:2Fe-2S ferredoxin
MLKYRNRYFEAVSASQALQSLMLSMGSRFRGNDVVKQYKRGKEVPQIVILPHPVFCPEGAVLEGQTGKSICDTLLDNDIEIEHACDRVCACTTCHVIVREGFDSLNEQEEKEEDMLDKAWGLEPNSRLSCQAIIAEEDLVVEIPKYTINHAAENH